MKTFAATIIAFAAASQIAAAGIPERAHELIHAPDQRVDVHSEAAADADMIVAGRYGQTKTPPKAINGSSRGRYGGT